EDVGAIPLEELMRLDRKENVKVARRAAAQTRFALAGEANACAVLDTRRDVHRQGAFPHNPAGTRTLGARIVDDFTTPLTVRAGALDREETLRRPNPPVASTGRAGRRFSAGPRSGAGAFRAGHARRHTDFRRLARIGILKRDLEVVSD